MVTPISHRDHKRFRQRQYLYTCSHIGYHIYHQSLYTINCPNQTKVFNHGIIHTALKPCGLHGGNVTDCRPDASVPYDSCICSTRSTTNQKFRRYDHKCEGGFQHYTKVLTVQPKSIWPRVFKQIRLQSTTLRRLQYILCQHHQCLRYCSSQSAYLPDAPRD